MNNVPRKLRKQLSTDPEYQRTSHCMLAGYHQCGGRNTWEHPFIFAGRQIQEAWAIICVCAAGQDVDQYQDSHRMDKEMNRWVALNRATDDDLKPYSRVINYIRERERLNTIFGPYVPWTTVARAINY